MLNLKHRITLWAALIFLVFTPLVAQGQTVLFEDFEAGWGSWFADNGVWEVGTPTAGPAACYAGSQCAGTVLGGNYPPNTDSRLISPAVTLPAVLSGEEIHLLFNNWFAYRNDTDHGVLQVSSFDGVNWSAWQTVGGEIGGGEAPAWSLTGRELTAYAGETIRIAFYHTADSAIELAGWYVDDVQITKRTPNFGGDFESGWGDWYSDNGVWDVGTPTAGPPSCHAGSNCAGTILDGNYAANTDSQLISPSITLNRSGIDPINLRFFHWFAYRNDTDHGEVQVSSFNSTTSEWSVWSTIGSTIISSSSVWSPTVRDLTAYAGETIRIAFYHTADSAIELAGWYVDDVEITGIVLGKTLTVTLSGTGSGNVISAPPGIDCPTDCSEVYVDPIDVTLIPTADAGSIFTGWSGDCTGFGPSSVTMNVSHTCDAKFDLVSHNVTVTLAGTGTGTVSSSLAGISCAPDCTENYPHNSLVTLTPTADPGSSFDGWSGDCIGTAPFDLTVDSAKRCTATFNAGDTCGTFIINQTETTNAPTMRTTVTVLDDQGNPVQGLDASDFTLDEDSEFRTLTLVTPPDPLSVGLVIDTSGSISTADLAEISTASKDFIDLLEVTDSVAVYDFDNVVKLLQDYTTDKDAAKAAIDLLASGGSTAMADALFKAGLDAQPLAGRQGLILMSDGYENSSSHSVQEGIDAALAAGVPVFTIGFGNQDAITLQDIATQTGGEYFSGAGAADLAAILASIGSRLTNQYELEWTSGFCDGLEHALDMTASFGALPSCDLAASSIYSQEGSSCGPSCTAVRELPTGYTPEIGVGVCVTVTGEAVSSYAVEDAPPAAWVVDEGSIDNGGIYDSDNNKVKWGPFFDEADRALCYTVTPQTGAAGCEVWDGSISLDGLSDGICGDLELCVGGIHPADLDDNLGIPIDEMTAYTGAWRDGSPWPRAPSPVTTAYAVNAATIWRNGEHYHFDPNAIPVPFVPDATSPFAVLTLAAGVEAVSPTTERSFESDGAEPGIPVTVSIAVTPESGTLVWAVEETPPEGWTITGISDGGLFDDQAKQIRWGIYLDTTPRILTYDVTPPSACGIGQFEGEVVFDSATMTIGGTTLLSCNIVFKDGFE